jgi:hypothetical protein
MDAMAHSMLDRKKGYEKGLSDQYAHEARGTKQRQRQKTGWQAQSTVYTYLSSHDLAGFVLLLLIFGLVCGISWRTCLSSQVTSLRYTVALVQFVACLTNFLYVLSPHVREGDGFAVFFFLGHLKG